MTVRNLGIIGGGTMGGGIAEVAAKSAINVVIQEPTVALGERAIRGIAASLDEAIAKWAITESEKRAILSRIKTTDSYKGFEKVDFVK